MKVYVFTFEGHYLGGEAVIVAATEREAFETVRKFMDDRGLSRQTPKLDRMIDPVIISAGPQIAWFHDGDY